MKRLGRVKGVVVVSAALLAAALFVYSQAELVVGYAVVTPRRGSPPPIATALFTFRNAQDVLVSEAAVAAVEPISRGRIFVDQRGAATGIALANPSDAAIVLDLVLRDVDGREVDREPMTLLAGAHVAEFVNQTFPDIAADFIGSLTFETRNPDQSVGAVTIRQGQNARGEPLFATLPVVDLSDGAAAQGAADTVVFPHIGAGTILATQIILINRTAQRTAGLIRLTSSAGQPLELDMNGVTASEFPYELEPNGVFFAELTSAEGVQQGYAVVTASQGSLPAGTAVFRFTSGGLPVSEAGVAEIPPTRRARIFVDNNNTQTGVAIASPNDRPVDVTFDLLDRNGVLIESTTVRIPTGGHMAIFADQLFELPDNFTGQIEINALRDVVPITLKFTTNQRGDFILTTLPVADFNRLLEADLLIFPQVGFGAAAGVGSFITRLIFINLDDVQSAGGSIAFFRSPEGSPLEVPLGGQRDSEFAYEVAAESARQFFPGVESDLALIIIDEANLVVNEGATSALRPITLDEEGNARDDFPLTFNSLEPGTVSVDQQGTMRGLSRGFSTVTVSSGGIVATVTVTVATITGGDQGLEVTGIAQDFARRVYLSNTGDHTILTAEDVTAPIELFAGRQRAPGFVNDLRLQSRFNQPAFIALNQADGSLFVSDSVNHAVRIVRIGDAGEVETLAGNGQPGSQDGTLAAARFNNPQGLALDAAGNLWVVDSDNHTIRRIRLADGAVETIAGLAGVAGFSDGTGSEARFNSPRGIALEAEPLALQLERALTGDPPPPVTMIVADTGNNILRRVREDGMVETVDDSGDATLAGGPRQGRRPPTPVLFNSPEGVVVDEFGNIFVSEPASRRVRALLRDGQLVQAAQTGTFGEPRGLAVTTRGRVVVAEDLRSAQEIRYAGPSIGEVSPARISAVGGARVRVTGRNFASDTLVVLGGVRIDAASVEDTSTITFTAPDNLPSGRLTLTLQHRGGLDQAPLQVDPVPLSAVNPGDVTTVAGGTPFGGDFQLADRASLGGPAGSAFDSEGNLFVADADHNRIRRVDAITRIITTVLGQGPVRLNNPQAVALDALENLYVADTGNHLVLRLRRSDGSVTRLAGTGDNAFGGDGGPATQASLSMPSGIAVASNGDVYVSDTGNGRIRRISAADGTISTVANAGDALQGAAPATPRGIAFDRLGNLYVADEDAHAVWRIDAQGNPERFAGSGQEGFSGDNGPAVTARLSRPADVAVDSSGNVLIADIGNHRVRRVSAATGIITTAAGTGVAGFAGDGGAAQSAALNRPAGLAFNGADDAFVADAGNGRVRRIAAADGTIATYAGNGLLPDVGDGIAAGAALNFPVAVGFDDQDRLLIADSGHHRVRRVFRPSGPGAFLRSWFSPAGEAFLDTLIETLAGNGEEGFSGDGGDPLNASLNQPAGVAFDPHEGVLVADTENHRIRQVRAAELTGSFLRLSATSVIDTIAGTGQPGFSGDGGDALAALLNAPHAVLSDGRFLFIADRENHRIRRLDLQTGVISTIAGNGNGGFSGDGGSALAARLNGPRGLALEGQTLLVADTDNHRIRRIDLGTGVITTLAGNGTAGFSGDGGPAASASLNRPSAVAFDSQGGILIGDGGNRRIRRVDAATSRIATLAGVGVSRFGGDGGPAAEASLSGVGGLAVDSDGNIYFSDLFNHRIRAIRSP